MNSTYIWILFPAFIALILLLLIRWRTLSALIAAATAIILAGLAAWLPAQEQLVLWRWSFPFSDTFNFFGRQFVLAAGDRPALVVLYLAAALWFAAVPVARPTRLFTPLALGILALLTAAIAVEPFLFAAVIIEIAVLLSIPILSVPGRKPGRGVLRYLSFQTLGMPFLLISGFLFSGFESGPGEPVFVAIATAMLVIGFALLLAVFPFHSWIPMISEETHPFAAAFIFLLLPISVLFLALGFLDNFAWVEENANVVLLIQVLAAVMIVTAGIWSAVERNLSRLVGFAVILDIGFSLLTISLIIGEETGLYRILFYTGLIVRALSLGLFVLSLSVLIDKLKNFEIGNLRGLARKAPVISISLIAALLCLAGTPVFAGFPLKLGLIEEVSAQSLAISIWILLGSLGLVIGTIRVLISLVSDANEEQESAPEPRLVIIYLVIGVGLLLLIGLVPNFFLELFTSFSAVFGALG